MYLSLGVVFGSGPQQPELDQLTGEAADLSIPQVHLSPGLGQLALGGGRKDDYCDSLWCRERESYIFLLAAASVINRLTNPIHSTAHISR